VALDISNSRRPRLFLDHSLFSVVVERFHLVANQSLAMVSSEYGNDRRLHDFSARSIFYDQAKRHLSVSE
jgi:hypothetical protein